jgi:Ran GTPase-activating protein (RanGAP) involved in mRNA processing and transport
MERMLDAPISQAVLNPVPEQFELSPLEQMQPLFDWLTIDEPLDLGVKQFTSGKVTLDGRLDLCKQVVGPQGIGPLLKALSCNTNIKRLLLGNNMIGDNGGRLIAEYIRNGKSRLTVWYIAGNQLSAAGIEPIAEALKSDKQVTALWLKRNPLRADGMRPIGDLMAHNDNIRVLDLLNCGLLDEGVALLMSGLKLNSSLRHLYLGSNGITPTGVATICDYLEASNGGRSLLGLCLSCNRLGDDGVQLLSAALTSNAALERLNLASNRIGSAGMQALAEALQKHPRLQVLDLGYMKATLEIGELGNWIGDEGAPHVAKLIERSKSLLALSVAHNQITQRGMQTIVEAITSAAADGDAVSRLVHFDYIQFGVSLNELMLNSLRNKLNENKLNLVLERPGFDMQDLFMPEHVKQIYSLYRTH